MSEEEHNFYISRIKDARIFLQTRIAMRDFENITRAAQELKDLCEEFSLVESVLGELTFTFKI